LVAVKKLQKERPEADALDGLKIKTSGSSWVLIRVSNTEDGVRVRLIKHVPVARGLGGGSSDAAIALLGVQKLARRLLPPEELLDIAAGLGADVPFFLYGGRALGVGRGEEIYPLPEVPKRWLAVVSPSGIGISTRQAYAWASSELTKRGRTPKLRRFCALCWSNQGTVLGNDFEAAVFRRHPRLARIKRALFRHGAAEVALAGSGSAVFGVFPSPAKSRRAAMQFPNDQVFVVETLSREEYRRALALP
jgi:4-diphosphocytidyl-2-C-methyl-D-erythritol kinase